MYKTIKETALNTINNLFRFDVEIRDYTQDEFKHNNSSDYDIRIYSLDYDLEYRFSYSYRNRYNCQFNSEEKRSMMYDLTRETEHACERLIEEVISKIFKELMSGHARSPILIYLMSRLNIRQDLLVEAFRRLDVITKDCESSREVFISNDMFKNNYRSFHDYSFIDFISFQCSPMRMSRGYIISLNRFDNPAEKVFKEMLLDFDFIMNDNRGRGKRPYFMDSIIELLNIRDDIMDQIELYNCY